MRSVVDRRRAKNANSEALSIISVISKLEAVQQGKTERQESLEALEESRETKWGGEKRQQQRQRKGAEVVFILLFPAPDQLSHQFYLYFIIILERGFEDQLIKITYVFVLKFNFIFDIIALFLCRYSKKELSSQMPWK